MWVGDLVCPFEQPDGGGRGSRRADVGGPTQPVHRFAVAPVGAEREVGRHPLGWSVAGSEGGGDLTMQGPADWQREIVIDGVADEVVTERETAAGLADEAGFDGGRQG